MTNIQERDMIDTKTIQAALDQFIGSDTAYKWSVLAPGCRLTDGTKYLAAAAGAYWLMDVIASYQRTLQRRHEFFQVWRLEKNGSAAVVTCTNEMGDITVRQEIPFTDFPLDSIKLYATWTGGYLLIQLPSEY
jgi:hypothetical protein